MNLLTKALADGYEQVAQWRVEAFRQGWFRQHKVKVPVISVGNLTVGGTGKTPVTAFLLQTLLDKGRRPAGAAFFSAYIYKSSGL
jgi:tetraacyldisaccharide 4'-kinase